MTPAETREKLKLNGLKETANRISKKWFILGDKAKYFYICDKAGFMSGKIRLKKNL